MGSSGRTGRYWSTRGGWGCQQSSGDEELLGAPEDTGDGERNWEQSGAAGDGAEVLDVGGGGRR